MNEAKQLTTLLKQSTKQVDKNKQVQKIIKDKTIPLEDRWELYTLAVSTNYLVDRDSFYFCPGHIKEIEEIGFDGENRHETYDYGIIFDINSFTEEEEIIIKEDILQDGHSSWVYDW